MDFKRKRSENWNEDDKTLLKDLIRDRVKEIENKNTDSNTNQSKKRAWQEVAESFNHFCTGGHRTITQLKNQWVATKVAAKKTFSEHRKEIYKTGGGAAPSEYPTCSNDISVWLPNEFVIDSNEFDSDAIIIEETINPNFESVAVIEEAFHEPMSEEKSDIIITPADKKNGISIKSKPIEKKKTLLKPRVSEQHIKKLTDFDMQCRKELHELQMRVEEAKLEVQLRRMRNLDRELEIMEER